MIVLGVLIRSKTEDYGKGDKRPFKMHYSDHTYHMVLFYGNYYFNDSNLQIVYCVFLNHKKEVKSGNPVLEKRTIPFEMTKLIFF